jgi:hypothetical protein
MLVPITSRPYLSIVAAVANRDLPKVLDDETEMMSVTPLDGVLVYRYRLIKRLAADLDGTAFARTIRPILIKGACADAELRETLLKPGVKLRHVYGDQRGMDVATIEVAWADCGLTR